MTDAERNRRAMALFKDVCDVSAAERESALNAACGADRELRRLVESMLQLDGAEDAFVEAGESGRIVADIVGVDEAVSNHEDAPEQIGPYRIVRKIGEGGMGIIYEAEQESPRRRVALKVLRAGMIGRSMLKRFQHEAHVLGQLQHSGIAQIFEAGIADTSSGRQPFFVMELIEGERLDAFAKSNELDIWQRLELAARVCDAVQHAHQKGIIHRDLKPSNVLITLSADDTTTGVSRTSTSQTSFNDSIGQPKVLDFGIARVTDSDMQTVTMQTEVGQLVGTLAYMSPEQVEGISTDLDTRCDVYALGVMLYELLTGQRPYDLAQLPVTEAARRIREVDPPRIGTIDRRFRGDIETIVAKAIEKDRERRYGSAAELAADIRRHLTHQPIDARPASTFYQAAKFTRRHKGLVAGLVAAILALSVGLALTARSARRANEATILAKAEGKRAQDESARAREESERAKKALSDLQLVSDFQQAVIKQINIQEMGDLILKEATEQINDDDAAKAFMSTLKELNPTNLARAVVDGSMLSKASQAARQQFADRPVMQADILETLAETYFGMGMYDQALNEAKSSLDLRRQHLGNDHAATIRMIGSVVYMLNNMRRAEEAEPLAEEALKRLLATRPEDEAFVLVARFRLITTKQKLGHLNEAIELSETLVRTAERVLAPDDYMNLVYKQQLANCYHLAGRYEDVLPIREELLIAFRSARGENDPSTLGSWSQLAQALGRVGRLDEAEAAYREVFERADAALGGFDPRTLRVLQNLAEIQGKLGKLSEARSSFENLLKRQERALPAGHPAIGKTASKLDALNASEESPENHSNITPVRQESERVQRL